jgi:hypothetical protein
VTSRATIYVFRASDLAAAGDTWATVAPLDTVVAVYGQSASDGALRRDLVWQVVNGPGGMAAQFGGAAVFRDDDNDEYYLGVWGARKAARFRTVLRKAGIEVEVIKSAPPGRLAWYQTQP